MSRRLAFAGIALGLSLIGYAVFARETDEEKIHRLLGHLEKSVRVDGDTATNPLFRAGQLRKDFVDIFDKNVSYQIPELSTPSQTSESLVALAARSSVGLKTLDVSFTRIDVQIVPPGTSATTDTVAKIRAFRGSGAYEDGQRRIHFDLTKSGADWRITSFTVNSSRD